MTLVEPSLPVEMVLGATPTEMRAACSQGFHVFMANTSTSTHCLHLDLVVALHSLPLELALFIAPP